MESGKNGDTDAMTFARKRDSSGSTGKSPESEQPLLEPDFVTAHRQPPGCHPYLQERHGNQHEQTQELPFV